MTDGEALEFLVGKMKKQAALADALGVSDQTLHNWKKRGIAASMRPAVWAMVNDHGGHLPREWLIERAA